jgi:hypothetical protein
MSRKRTKISFLKQLCIALELNEKRHSGSKPINTLGKKRCSKLGASRVFYRHFLGEM